MAKHAPRGPLKASTELAPMKRAPIEAVRCSAHSSRTGKPCQKYPIAGATVCRTHGGAAPQVQRKAAERLAELVPKAIQKLDALMDRDEYPSVQFAASKAVIEFAEGKATERVEQEHSGGLVISWQTSES